MNNINGLYDEVIDRTLAASSKWEQRADNLKKEGIIPFSVADMEFKAAPAIRQALMQAVEMGVYGYTIVDDVYRNAVTGWFAKRHNFIFPPESILCNVGVVQALHALVREFTEQGDGVIVQPPVYYPFFMAIENSGRVIAENPLVLKGGKYSMNLDELEILAKKPENTMMILCSPHNPVGRVWDESELKAVADICKKHGVLLVSDEIHCDLTKKRHVPAGNLGEKYTDNLIVCTSTGKTFNLAGFTTANTIILNPVLRKRFENRLLTEAIGNMNYFARTATIAAYTQCEEWVDGVNAYIRDNYTFLRDVISRHPSINIADMEGTYLAWINLSALGLDNDGLKKFMDEKALMPVGMGHVFGTGGSGFIRVNIAAPRKPLSEALERFDRALSKEGL